MRHTSLSTLLLVMALVPGARAATIAVDWRGGADYETIQGGLDAAASGDTVLVADGTYSGPDNTDLDFHGAQIELRAVEGAPHQTIIDCEGICRAFLFDDGEDALAVVDGFTLISGVSSTGGAIRIVDASPTIRNCTIESCTAHERGGGIRVVRGQPVIYSCSFSGNYAIEGGAIAVADGSVTLIGCTLDSNEAEDAGGALLFTDSSGLVQDCVFEDNRSDAIHWSDERGEGGAARIIESEVSFVNCDFIDNKAARGGALSLRRPAAVDAISCLFESNNSESYGAALHMYGCSPVITNCLFTENEPTGGGTIWGEYSSPTLSFCTFRNNKGTYEPDIGHDVELYHTDIENAVIENCTFCGWRMHYRDDGALLRFGDCEPLVERCIIAFYNYGPGVTCTGTGQPTIRECVVFGNTGGDEICGDDPSNNLVLDPLFCGFWEGDLSLCANSPCLPPFNPWNALIGAHEVGCGNCDTPVEHVSWGTIKAMFR